MSYQSALFPNDSLLLVCICVGVSLNRAGVAAEEAVEVGADLVTLARLEGVALRASCLEQVGALLRVTYRSVSRCEPVLSSAARRQSCRQQGPEIGTCL